MHAKKAFAVILIVSVCGLFLFPGVEPSPASGAVHQLTFPGVGGVINYQLSPDGGWAVYRVNDTTNQVISLYSVRLSGGAPVRLAAVVTPNERSSLGFRDEFVISADSQRVLYFGRPEASPALTPTPPPNGSTPRFPGYGLYSVPIGGSGPSTLIVDDPYVHHFALSPNGQYAFYTTGPDAEGGLSDSTYLFELYRKPIAGGPAVRMNIDLPANQTVALEAWSVLDSGYVLYEIGDLTYSAYGSGSSGNVAVYSVPVEGTAAQSARLTTCGTASTPSAYRTSGDGRRVVIMTYGCNGSAVALFSMEPTGAHAVLLTTPSETRGSYYYLLSADGQVVHYALAGIVNSQYVKDYYAVPAQGPSSENHLIQAGSPTGINPDLAGLPAPNGQWVAFTDIETSSPGNGAPVSLYVAERTGTSGAPRLVTNSFPPYDAWTYFSQDSQYLIYWEIDGLLRSLDLSSPASQPVLLGIQASTTSYLQTHPATTRLIARGGPAGILYSVPVAGPDTALETISHEAVGWFANPAITSDGQKVVYISNVDNQLYITDIDPNAPPTTATPSATAVISPSPTAAPTATQTPGTASHQVYLPALNR